MRAGRLESRCAEAAGDSAGGNESPMTISLPMQFKRRSGRKEIIEMLRQRSRPYLFSNTVAPSIVAASLKVLELLSQSDELRVKLFENTRYFREEISKLGFNILPGVHPIVPIMLGDAVLAQKMAARLLEKGVYVIGFFYPVVPQGKARIRTQISAAHSRADLEFALQQFAEVKAEFGM